MIAVFTFDADDRTFGCRVEKGRAEDAQPWWWFSVSGDGHRYAPFQATPEDTMESVRERVLSYYRALLVRRAMPLDQRTSWKLRRDNLAALKKS
jgi:hypothetical protein